MFFFKLWIEFVVKLGTIFLYVQNSMFINISTYFKKLFELIKFFTH